MKNFNKLFLILLLIFIYTSISAFSYVNAVSTNIKNNVLRLHVIANSNSEEDQNLKYLVRNSILEYIKINFPAETTKKEIMNFTTVNLDKIEKIAQDTVIKNGYNYSVTVHMGNYFFPTKTYGDISFPAGFYDALKIEIGNAKGQNWWCVMFPPLCFVDTTSGIVPEDSKENLKSNLSNEEYSLLSKNSNDFKFKFKIVEMFQNINVKIGQK